MLFSEMKLKLQFAYLLLMEIFKKYVNEKFSLECCFLLKLCKIQECVILYLLTQNCARRIHLEQNKNLVIDVANATLTTKLARPFT